MRPYNSHVGMDIAATWADIACGQELEDIADVGQYQRTPAGIKGAIAALLKRVADPATTLVVMEATSTYWMDWAIQLHAAGFAISVVNAKHTHHFAKSLRPRAKTDRLDARMLTHYAITNRPPLWTPPPTQFEDLQQRLTLRDDLIKARTAFKNQLHALSQRSVIIERVALSLRQQIEQLTLEIDQLEQEIAAILQQDHAWNQSAQRLLSIPGVGIITTAWILTATLNFAGCSTPQQAASFAGLAPHPKESGSSIKSSDVIGNGWGHADLRRALYLATLPAARYNPIIKSFYDRLKNRAKLTKVARCAAARKLLHIAWAVVVKDCDFDPHHAKVCHNLLNAA